MKYSKFFQFAYLVIAALFLYDVVATYITDKIIAYPSLLLAALAIFVFFFRRRFYKKMAQNKKQ